MISAIIVTMLMKRFSAVWSMQWNKQVHL